MRVRVCVRVRVRVRVCVCTCTCACVRVTIIIITTADIMRAVSQALKRCIQAEMRIKKLFGPS